MKKVLGLVAVFMIILSSMAYAAGGKNTGDKAAGPAGETGAGSVSQARSAS